ncbi:MAG: radical SAM family heme chaperone HemW [Pseudomonadota bacterium]
MAAIGPRFGFGLYVHWPYCARICPYCDFNVYAAKDRESAPLLDAMVKDLAAHRTWLTDHPSLDSIFFGGGTPSLLNPLDLSRLVQAAQKTFGLTETAEITLEANPNDINPSQLDGWKAAGINRLSIGVQSLNDGALSFLGRDHDSARARAAIAQVRPVFDDFSIDLIYARPGQTNADWQQELTEALDLGAPHLSLYELTIEDRTAFGKRAARGELMPLPDDDQADLYEVTQRLCDARGLAAYEVSNHAKASDYESRHNHIYWASGDWIGIGPGAHGRLTVDGQRYATEAARRPADYLNGMPTARYQLSSTDTAREFLAMALRPIAGLDLNRFEQLFGRTIDARVLTDLRENGLGTVVQDALVLSPSGRLMADHIASLLDP